MKDLNPLEFYLGQNYPNPFKEKTTIKYCLPYKTRVNLTVYDCRGKLIKKLIDEEKDAGTYEVEFSVRHSGESDVMKRNLQSGNYKYLIVAGYYSNEKTMAIVK